MKHASRVSYALLLLVLLASGNAFGERMYKWVDANGEVHYSNQLPPEASRQKREVLDKQGRTVKVYQAPLTPEEKTEQDRLAKLEARKIELAKKRANYDRSLLASFSRKEDIYKARDAKISAVESLISMVKSRIDSMQQRLQGLTEEAADLERSGKKLSRSLLTRMANLRTMIERNEQFIEEKKREIEDIRLRYENDIRRYTELKTNTSKAAARDVQPSRLDALKHSKNIKLDRHDRTLLATYDSEQDLIFARDQELNSINESIGDTSKRLDALQNRLAEVSDNTSEYQDRNEIPPNELLDQMQNLIDEMNSTQTLLEEKRKEKAAIEARFSADLDRYRALLASSKQ
jgi:chromosome segregation ATPase